jgi:hypothetical protein
VVQKKKIKAPNQRFCIFLSYKNTTQKKISLLNRFLGGPPPSQGGSISDLEYDLPPVFEEKEDFLEIVKRQWMKFVDDYNAGSEIETPQFIEEFHNHAIELKGDLTLKRFLDFLTYPMPLLGGKGGVFKEKKYTFGIGRYWYENMEYKLGGSDKITGKVTIRFLSVSCHTIPKSGGEEEEYFFPNLSIIANGYTAIDFTIPKALTRDDVMSATLRPWMLKWREYDARMRFTDWDEFAQVAGRIFNPDVITDEDLTTASLSSSADIFELGYFFDRPRGKRYDLSCKGKYLSKYLSVKSRHDNLRTVINRGVTLTAWRIDERASISYIINDGDDDDENFDDVKQNERKRDMEKGKHSVIELLKYLYFDYVNLMSVPNRLPIGYYTRNYGRHYWGLNLEQYVEMLLRNGHVKPMLTGDGEGKKKENFRYVLDYLKVVENPPYEWRRKFRPNGAINPPFKRNFSVGKLKSLPPFLLHENDEEMFSRSVKMAYEFYSLLVEYGYNYFIADRFAMSDPLLNDGSDRRFRGGLVFFDLLEKEIRRVLDRWGSGGWMLISTFRLLFRESPEAYGVIPNYYNLIEKIAEKRADGDFVSSYLRNKNLEMDDETRQRELEAYMVQVRRERAEQLREDKWRRLRIAPKRRIVVDDDTEPEFWSGLNPEQQLRRRQQQRSYVLKTDQQIEEEMNEGSPPPRKRKRKDADAAAMLLRRFNQDIEAAAQMLARMKF